MEYTIRDAVVDDVDKMLVLFPRLAEFEIPEARSAEDLWRGDAQLLQKWARGLADQCILKVAVDRNGKILGLAIVQMGEELLSHDPSAHLEVLVVAAPYEGNGIGKALINEAEKSARLHGALTMTLHVFSNNTRARRVYEQLGFSGELIRYIKHLD